MNKVKELKNQLLEIVSKYQRFEYIAGDQVTFLKAGLMLTKSKAGNIRLYDTHGVDDYVEITNQYILNLILQDYEARFEKGEKTISRDSKLEKLPV